MSEYNYDDRYAGTPNEGEPESENAAGGMQESIKAAKARLNAAYEKTRQSSNEALKQAEAYVRQSPLEAIGYAAGVAAVIGFVAGMLIGRKE